MKYVVKDYNGAIVAEINGIIELYEDIIKFYKNEDGVVKVIAVFNSRHVFAIEQ
jgi:hypothetical protein